MYAAGQTNRMNGRARLEVVRGYNATTSSCVTPCNGFKVALIGFLNACPGPVCSLLRVPPALYLHCPRLLATSAKIYWPRAERGTEVSP